MPAHLQSRLRSFACLVRLEGREARGIVGLVVGINLLLVLGVAWFARREGFELAFDTAEALLLGHLAFVGFLPVLADVLGGDRARAASGAMARLPVAS